MTAMASRLFIDSSAFRQVVDAELASYPQLSQFIARVISNEEEIDHMIQDYFHFMNRHIHDTNSKGVTESEIALTDSVRLMWKIHLLHPKTYRMDCFKRFGRVILPSLDDLALQFKQTEHIQHVQTHNNCRFTNIDLKKSLISHYNFIQKVLQIVESDRKIDEWLVDYKQFMASIGALQNDCDIIEPSVQADLIWHCHQLLPSVYFKESLILANGKFVRHIVDLEEYKEKQARKFASKQNINYSYFALAAIFLVLTTALIISVLRGQTVHNQPISNQSHLATTDAGIACSGYDDLLCGYINGLTAIFETTDSLLSTAEQGEFFNVSFDLSVNDDNLILYMENSNEILSNNSSPFNDPLVVADLVDIYGDNLCETASVLTGTTPDRTSTASYCYGWLYVADPDNITSVETPPSSPGAATDGYAVLMGKVVDFEADTLYYLYPVALEYSTARCLSDSRSCDIANSQQLLGNALFYISLSAYSNGFATSSSIWSEMNNDAYFEYASGSYQFYVFVNRYSDGYRFVHGESDKVGTRTNLNSELRVGANQEYGAFVEYTRSSGEEKRAYVMGPYPNPATSRIYVGSGYTYDTDGAEEASAAGTYAALGVIGVCVVGCVVFRKRVKRCFKRLFCKNSGGCGGASCGGCGG